MRVLVMSGGGSKGAFQTGVLKHLLGDLEKHYDSISGVSVGAINAAYLGMFKKGQEKECIENLEKFWNNLSTKDIYVGWVNLPKPFYYLGYLVSLFKSSLYNSTPLENLIKNNYNLKKLSLSGKTVRVGAVSVNTGKYRLFDQTYENFIDAILASSSFPMAFKPIKIEGEFWTDGGVKEITPLKSAFLEKDIDEIDVIMTSPKGEGIRNYEKPPKLLKLGPRILDIMSEEILDNDLDKALKINELIRNGVVIPGKKYVPINIYRPTKQFKFSSLSFEQEDIQPMMAAGYKRAKEITGA